MVRYETTVEDGTVFVTTAEGRLEVGDLETILELVGGPAWTISYADRTKERHPELDTSDEGLTIDVVDAVNAMTFDEAFVETLAAQPVAPVEAAPGGHAERPGETEAPVSPRLGLFVGRLLENLEYGLR